MNVLLSTAIFSRSNTQRSAATQQAEAYWVATLARVLNSLPAGRRRDAVHAQVFHHLPIVIVGMGHRIYRKLDSIVLPRRTAGA